MAYMLTAEEKQDKVVIRYESPDQFSHIVTEEYKKDDAQGISDAVARIIGTRNNKD